MTPERKRLFTIIILTVLCLIIVTELGNFRSKQLAVDLADKQIKLALSRVARELNQDSFRKVVNSMDENNSHFGHIRSILINIRKEHGLADLYLFAKNEQENNWFYVADAKPDGDPARVSLGEVDKNLFGPLEGVLRGKTVEKEYYRTAGGFFITSYLGINDPEGKIIAVVGGDYPARELSDFLYLTRYVQAGIIFISFLLIGSTVFIHRRKTG